MLRAYASGRVFGERYGEGPPAILALHGWRRSRADFAASFGGDRPADDRPPGEGPAAAGGRPSFGALAVDLPGHGASPEPERTWGSPEYADVLVEILDAMDDRIVVVGHSFGGRVAVHLATRCPERIAGLVLTGVPLLSLGPSRRPSPRYRLIRAGARAGLLPGSALASARRRYGSADYRAAEGTMRDVFVRLVNERYEDQLGSLACPVELVWGELDTVVPVAVAERVATMVETSRLTVLGGVGHLTPTEAPEALRAAASRLLA